MSFLDDIINWPIIQPEGLPPDHPCHIPDPYPGKDFIVGLMDEGIAMLSSELAEPFFPPRNKCLAVAYLDLYKKIRARRLRLLLSVKLPSKVQTKVPETPLSELETWLRLNPSHPNYELKLREYEQLSDVVQALF